MLRDFFRAVHEARQLFTGARLVTFLFPRDEGCRRDLENIPAEVWLWERSNWNLIISLLKPDPRVMTPKELIQIEFLAKGQIRVSTVRGRYTFRLAKGNALSMFRRLMEEDREFSFSELTRALDVPNTYLKVYKWRLNKRLKTIPTLLGITMRITKVGYRKGYHLIAQKIKPPSGGLKE
jgi:hypothetical protein